MKTTALLIGFSALLCLIAYKYGRLYILYRKAITLNKLYEKEIARLKEGSEVIREEDSELVKKIDEIIFKRGW